MGKWNNKQKPADTVPGALQAFPSPEELQAAISSAVSAGIAEAIGEGGAIATWADARYQTK